MEKGRIIPPIEMKNDVRALALILAVSISNPTMKRKRTKLSSNSIRCLKKSER
jgi:hypothetical protein